MQKREKEGVKMNMNFDLFEQNGMIETLESGLLLIKPQIIIPKKENIIKEVNRSNSIRV